MKLVESVAAAREVEAPADRAVGERGEDRPRQDDRGREALGQRQLDARREPEPRREEPFERDAPVHPHRRRTDVQQHYPELWQSMVAYGDGFTTGIESGIDKLQFVLRTSRELLR